MDVAGIEEVTCTFHQMSTLAKQVEPSPIRFIITVGKHQMGEEPWMLYEDIERPFEIGGDGDVQG